MNIFKQKEREFALVRLPTLKERFPESGEILDFLLKVLEFQKNVLDALSERPPSLDTSEARSRLNEGKQALKLLEEDLAGYVQYLNNLLSLLSDIGTKEISEGANYMNSLSEKELLSNVVCFLEGRAVDDVSRMVFMVWLQPILYTIADALDFDKYRWLKNTCPVCGFRPSVSFLMDTEEGEGMRFLRCSLCLSDWLYVRTKCVNCGNSEDDHLDYFVEGSIKHVHIQACRKCKHYIKVVDLREDGLAVPDLEDIATVSLDIWAKDAGLIKFERNLLGF